MNKMRCIVIALMVSLLGTMATGETKTITKFHDMVVESTLDDSGKEVTIITYKGVSFTPQDLVAMHQLVLAYLDAFGDEEDEFLDLPWGGYPDDVENFKHWAELN